jgi:hypothetical protein
MTMTLAEIARYGDGSSLSSYEPSIREKVNYWLAENWYGDTRDGVDKARKLSDILEFTPYGLATMSNDAGREIGKGNLVAGGAMLAMAGLPLPASIEKKAAQGIRAYHGSPHSFDKFSLDKIGTGEGAQAYGHGLYFAENEGVAKAYRDQLSPPPNTTQDIAQRAVSQNGGDTKKAADSLAQYLAEHSWKLTPNMTKEMQDAEQFLRSGEKLSPGSMYEVNINANPDDFLDWDKPLPMGHKARAVADEYATLFGLNSTNAQIKNRAKDAKIALQGNDITGEGAYRIVQDMLGNDKYSKEAATNAFYKEAGIPGIKYLDAGSRGAMTANFVDGAGAKFLPPDLPGLEGQRYRSAFETLKNAGGNYKDARDLLGDSYAPFLDDMAQRGVKLSPTGNSRNYVVFDDKLIQIVKKYGIAGASAMLGMDVLANMDDAQAAQLQNAENEGKMSSNRFAKYRTAEPTAAPQGGNRFSKYANTSQAAKPAVAPSYEQQTVNTAGKGDMGLAPGEVAPSTYAADIGRSLMSGLRSGGEMLVGLPGDMQDLTNKGLNYAAGKFGASPEQVAAMEQAQAAMRSSGYPGALAAPRTSDIQAATDTLVGPAYQPQTTPGKYSRTVGEFAPSALAGPGGVLRKTATTVLPAIASEAAGQLAEGSDYEALARGGAAVATALATGGRGNTTKQLAKNAPTQQAVKSATDKLYKNLRASDIVYDTNSFGRYMNYLANKLKAEGISAPDAPRSSAIIQELGGMANGRIDYANFESIRRRAARTAREAESTDKAAAAIVLRALDSFAENAPLATNGKVPPNVVNAMQKKARELAQRGIFVREIDDMMEKAKTYQWGESAGIRNQFSSYLRTKKGLRLQKQAPELHKAMMEAAKGNFTSNVLSTFGRFGFDFGKMGNIASLLPTAGAGATYAYTGDPVSAGTVLALGSAAKFGGRRMTVNQANRARQVALAGRKAQQSAGAKAAQQKASTLATAAIAGRQGQGRGSSQPAPVWPEGAFMMDAQGRYYDRSGNVLSAQ